LWIERGEQIELWIGGHTCMIMVKTKK
jgi:hypothetical protein